MILTKLFSIMSFACIAEYKINLKNSNPSKNVDISLIARFEKASLNSNVINKPKRLIVNNDQTESIRA